MPKLIDYPRTSYPGAWEVAEIVDDTGGKCALETSARKLNRKVSGSFKAIVGSAVKFGLLTSKREMLTTTTLFRRIKHAYDKQEELLFHREAFLHPPLFTQICRKFRSRELPVAMLDVLLIREFGVEEINAQGVAKAFVDGARMVNILDENNVIADIDQLAAQQPPRRELANPIPAANVFRQAPLPLPTEPTEEAQEAATPADDAPETPTPTAVDDGQNPAPALRLPAFRPAPTATSDAIATLFSLPRHETEASEGETPRPRTPVPAARSQEVAPAATRQLDAPQQDVASASSAAATRRPATNHGPASVDTSNSFRPAPAATSPLVFRIQVAGPGLNTQLDIVDAEDLLLVRALLNKIERQLSVS